MEKSFLKHYLREDVQTEISRFCKGRWVAVESSSISGRRVFYRYIDGKPVTIKEPSDLKKLINKLGGMFRTVYGSANIYSKLEDIRDLEDTRNIVKVTPCIDVDGSLSEVDLILKTAEIILEEFWKNGLEKSVYLVWSGRGIHVHVNENAVSGRFWVKDPVKIAHTLIEYVLQKKKEELRELCRRSTASDRRLKIENLIDVQRVFTAPLSLHRELDLVAVTVNPDELSNFSIDWSKIGNFKYWRDWDRFIEGEADKLLEKALSEIKIENITKTVIEDMESEKEDVGDLEVSRQSIGRFQVMALLQAARYYLLFGDLDLAKSFGLNRAIFYAWAKKRGITHRTVKPLPRTSSMKSSREVEVSVGDEVAFRREDGWFTIGGEEQRPVDFDRQIISRFGGRKEFEKYWNAALKYLENFPRSILESQKDFYEKVYLPVRDNPESILKKGAT
ncbi:MAG: hypothetical protein QW118_08320 [Nitrososphaerota archaeon]